MKKIILLLILFICFHELVAQQLNPLTQKDQDYIDELNEFAETLIVQESYQDAANTYNQLALFYWQKGFALDAIENFGKSIELNKRTRRK